MDREYKVYIDGVDYSKYLQLPFAINLRSDEAYDSGTFTLLRTNLKSPFEPYTPVRIEISDTLEFSDAYYMIVEEDEVGEYYIGSKEYYSHKITIIERTKILDGITLPNFSITNPAVGELVETFATDYNTWEKLTTDYGGDGMTGHGAGNDHLSGYSQLVRANWNEGSDAFKDFFNVSGYYAEMVIGWRSYFNVTSAQYPTVVPNGSKILLPRPTCSSTTAPYGYEGYIGFIDNAFWVSSTKGQVFYGTGYFPRLVYEYYYRDGNQEHIIGRAFVYPSTGTISSTQVLDSARFSKSGNNLYFTPPNGSTVTIGCRIFKPGYYTDTLGFGTADKVKNDIIYVFKNTLDYLDSNGTLSWESTKPWVSPNSTKAQVCQAYGEKALAKSNYYSQTRDTAKDATFERTVTSIATDSGNGVANVYASSTYKTIDDVLSKICDLIEPSFGTFTYSLPGNIGDIVVSERVYQEKTVSEILFDLSKLADAYPELDDNNVITFVQPTPIDNPLFNDSTEGTAFTLNTDNAVTTYVSEIENVVSTPLSNREIYSYWPDKTHFAHPNGLGDNFLTTPDTSAITISSSDGIYYLKSLEVTNCCNSGSYTGSSGSVSLGSNSIIDITPFIYEETYYNTLYNQQAVDSTGNKTGIANYSKDNCLFWKKGSNQITLDELESDHKTAFFGDSAPTTYKIQNAIVQAIKAKYGIVDFSPSNLGSNPTSYRYRVTYIDSAAMRLKTEKFNPSYQLPLASPYNQTSNTISGNDWGNAAQIDILRRGSLDRSKEIHIRNLTQIPILGEVLSDSDINYVADNINLSFNNTFVGCTVSYTKDYNKINKDVSISKEYRQYEIYDENLIDRYINIDRYGYLGNNMSGNISKIPFASQLRTGRKEVPHFALVYFKDINNQPIKYTAVNSSTGETYQEKTKGLLLPLSFTSSGNSFILKTALQDNYAAAYRADMSSNVKYQDVMGNTVSSGARLSTDSRYVDDMGEAYYMSVYIINPSYDNSFYNTSTFPETTTIESSVNLSYCIDYEKDIPIKKDNRERICIVYQQHYLSNLYNLKWNPGLVKYLLQDQGSSDAILRTKDTDTVTSNYYPAYYAFSYDIMNSTIVPLGEKIYTPNIDTTNDIISEVSGLKAKQDIKTIALVYPKTGEVIYHFTVNIKNGETYSIPKVYCNNFNTKQQISYTGA